ncbi:MAG: hypothetical protein ACR2O1_05030 [Boseongicola sp.]
MIPQFISIWSVVTGRCGGDRPNGAFLSGETLRYTYISDDLSDPPNDRYENLEELERQIHREINEADDLYDRIREALPDHPMFPVEEDH